MEKVEQSKGIVDAFESFIEWPLQIRAVGSQLGYRRHQERSSLGSQISNQNHIPKEANVAPRNKVAMDISFGTSTSYSLILARAFYDVRNPLYSATLSSVLCSL